MHDQPRLAEAYRDIEQTRQSLLANHSFIEVLDLGAGSRHARSPERKISTIAKYTLSTARFGQLYHRAITHHQAEYVLELGTSLGINAMYLAVHPGTKVTTIEGSPAVAALALSLFKQRHLKNIDVICGDINDQLPVVINKVPRIDFAFLDANHRLAPTIRYFDLIVQKVHAKSIIVLDDIHSSAEMQQAWNEVRNHRCVTGAADLFRCGFVFFDPSLNRQQFVLQI